MDMSQKSVNQQIRLWAILGPLMTLLIFSLYLVKQTPTSFSIALMALLGLLCCWQWRMKGLVLSLALVIGLLAYYFPGVDVTERFWFLGLAMATCLSLIVTVLSHEEIEGLIGGAHERLTKTRLRVAELVEEQKKERNEKERLTIDLDWLKEQKRDLEAKVEELEAKLKEKSDSQQITSHQELVPDRTQQLAEKYQVKRTAPSNGQSYEQLYKQLRQQFSEKGRLLDETRKELFAAQEKVACMTLEIEEMTKYKRDDYSCRLEQEFMALHGELENMDQMYRDEISELEGLVGALLSQN